jgi:hypothetical protein
VADDGKLAPFVVGGARGRRLHLLRIGQIDESGTREWDAHAANWPPDRIHEFCGFDDLPYSWKVHPNWLKKIRA